MSNSLDIDANILKFFNPDSVVKLKEGYSTFIYKCKLNISSWIPSKSSPGGQQDEAENIKPSQINGNRKENKLALTNQGISVSSATDVARPKPLQSWPSRVALKVISKKRLSTQLDVYRHRSEIEILKELQSMKCPGLIELLDYEETSTHLIYAMPCCLMGDLHFLSYKRRLLPETELQKFTRQILRTLRFMHDEAKIIHGDLKPENILLFSCERDSGILIKICDFGNSKRLNSENMVINNGAFGSYGFIAPEVFMRQNYSGKIDIFALGVILFTFLVGFEPFYPATDFSTPPEFLSDDFGHSTQEIRKFLDNLLKINQTERLDAATSEKSPWLHLSPLDISAANDAQRGDKFYPNRYISSSQQFCHAKFV